MDDDVSRLVSELKERIARLEERSAQIFDRMAKYEDDRAWILRLILGAVVLAVMSLVIVRR